MIFAVTVIREMIELLSAGSQNASGLSPEALWEQVISEVLKKNPKLEKDIEENKEAMKAVFLTAVAAISQKEGGDHYFHAGLESRLRQIRQSSERVNFLIDNKTPIGIAVVTIASILAAILSVIVSLPRTDNYYRELKLACSQVVVSAVKAVVVDVTIVAVSDVLALVSQALLLLPELMGSAEFINDTPVLKQMKQLSARRMKAYEQTFEDFAKFGLVVKLSLIGCTVEGLSEQDSLRFLQIMDRVMSHQDQYPDYQELIKTALNKVIESDGLKSKLMPVLLANKAHLSYLGDSAKQLLLDHFKDNVDSKEQSVLEEALQKHSVANPGGSQAKRGGP